ncbi:mitogen-activated protein kinase kinase kinase 3 isoform X2 [Elaeis guineensis]|uniref:mitogen-activated protein kinase kinase kinase n=1 Tax=Elaeis guineensis var. tenera TaxID=51953 RepID=A0A6I9QN90_ELAGV|nr:mitogen-activated protein kinase kinase kinase 3 isoform X2 [Elaeis guineensis]
MPAWWGKLKSKSKSTSSPRKKDEAAAAAAAAVVEEEKQGFQRGSKKEKANSFDEVLLSGKNRDPSPIGGARGRGLGIGLAHPLPRPSSISSPLPTLPHDHGVATATVSASASASSSSSSGSSEETPDLGLYRYSDPINEPRGRNTTTDSQRHHRGTKDRHLFSCSPVLEHPRRTEFPVSPGKEFQIHGFDGSSNAHAYTHFQTPGETVFCTRTPGSSPSRKCHPLPTSPRHCSMFSLCPGSPTQKQDDLRSPPHPLPLPPSSPSSSSTRSHQSQWKKGKLLGRGTFGHVYLGFNNESGQMCAIKEVKVISDDSNSKECLKQLSQEITLLSQLSHPNIVQYYSSEMAEDTLSVYLEYVSGGSIHKLLQDYGPFREPVIRSYTGQILSGLAYLHGRNTVHRDIKGANILVGPNGEIKLADFGMAKHMSSYTSIRSFKGSPYWMAPEVIMNGNGYNLSVDIWSLGCTILEMATSKPPWSQYEGVAAIFKIANSKDIPEIAEHLSSEAKSFLKLCLQRDPSARPTAAQLMDHPFVRDQPTIKAAKFNMISDLLPSSSDGSHTKITTGFSSKRSISPLHVRDHGIRHATECPSAFSSGYGNPSIRMNMSLPVSPCSSPLRQFKQCNRSCLPSPPHPAFSAEAINYSPINYALYPMRPSNNFVDPWPDVAPLKASAPFDSPRRL